MIDRRAAGILLHPTSLPGPWGIGDLGAEAFRFIDFLHDARMRLWQILPLGPTGGGNSPYAGVSSFAGNPMLISPELLKEEGLLGQADLDDPPPFPEGRVDYTLLDPWKSRLVRRAADAFRRDASQEERLQLEAFASAESFWLEDFVLFSALDEHFRQNPVTPSPGDEAQLNRNWERDIALREPEAVERWRERLSGELEIERIVQYLFHRQWLSLKSYAAEKRVEIIGDVPIFVAPDSADLWAARHNFLIDLQGRLEALAGVPPDYFSSDGQLWGNPLYDWEAMERDGFSWWFRRIEAVLKRVDWIRIDHFRGFQAFWRIPAGAESAVEGEWIEAPGHAFFRALKERMGDLPIIAEDLGVITEEVNLLRRSAGLPGMRVLQFAFEFDSKDRFNGQHEFLPHNYERNTVVYTGTHDNDTTAGWYDSRDGKIRDVVRRYLARDDSDIVWDLIRLALSSPAGFALIPFQDLHSLGTEARMNIPSTVGPHNWSWRMRGDDMDSGTAGRLREMNRLYGRTELPET